MYRLPFLAINILNAWINWLVSITLTYSKLTVQLDKQVKNIPYLFSSFRCSFRINGPSMSKPVYVKDGSALTWSSGRSVIFSPPMLPHRFWLTLHFAMEDLISKLILSLHQEHPSVVFKIPSHQYFFKLWFTTCGSAATMRHLVTRKRSTKRLKLTGNLFRKNLQL